MANAGFPLWHAIWIGYADTFRNFGKVLRLAWVPFLVVVLTTVILGIADGWRDQIPFLEEIWRNYREHISYAREFVVWLSFAIFAFAVFEWRLRGWIEGQRRIHFNLGRRQITFLSLVAGYFAIDAVLWEVAWRLVEHSGLDSYLTSVTINLLEWVVFLVELILLSRLVFVLPVAVCGDERLSDRAWVLGSGVWLSLIVLTLLTHGLLTLIDSVTTHAGISLYVTKSITLDSRWIVSELVSVVLTLKWAIISMLAIAIAAVALCEAYQARKAAFSDRELILPRVHEP
jgi:hypothetical protein